MTDRTTPAIEDVPPLTIGEMLQVHGGDDVLTNPDGQDDELAMSGHIKVKKLTSG